MNAEFYYENYECNMRGTPKNIYRFKNHKNLKKSSLFVRGTSTVGRVKKIGSTFHHSVLLMQDPDLS